MCQGDEDQDSAVTHDGCQCEVQVSLAGSLGLALLPKLRVNCGCGRRDNMQVIEAIAFVGIFLETTGGTWKRKEEF